METCEATCKLCYKDLFEEQKKQTSRTVSSIHLDLFELTVELVECSKERIHGALTKLPKYVCKACYSTVKKYVEIRPRLKTIQDNLIGLVSQDQVKDKVMMYKA